MKKIIFLMLGILLISSCGHDEKKQEPVRPVKVYEVGSEKYGKNISFPGVVSAKRETFLAFRIAGPVEIIEGDPGKRVKKGDVIAKLDERDYKVNLEASQRKFESAEKAYLANKAVSDNAVLQFQRVEKLYKANATTKKIYDEVLSKEKAAVATEKAAMAVMEEARQGVANAKNKLKDTVLAAPYDGYIVKKLAEAGTVVAAGVPVATIISDETPEVNISIAEKDIENLRNAEKITFMDLPVKLKEIGQKPDFSRQTYPVTLDFLQENDLKPGTNGNVVIKINPKTEEAIKVPIEAVFDKNGTKVWTYEDGVVKLREIKLSGLSSSGMALVSEGLNKGDKVITAGVHNIYEGQKVKLLSPKTDTNVGNVL